MRGKRILINPIDDYCDLKGEFIMASIVKPGTLHEKAGFIEGIKIGILLSQEVNES